MLFKLIINVGIQAARATRVPPEHQVKKEKAEKTADQGKTARPENLANPASTYPLLPPALQLAKKYAFTCKQITK